MAGSDLDKGWGFDFADVHDVGAAGAKGAAWRRVKGAGNFPRENDAGPFFFLDGIRKGDGGEKGLCVGVKRVCV